MNSACLALSMLSSKRYRPSVFSLGLAVPWAMVRLARYRAARFELLAMGGLDDFTAEAALAEGAAGAELVDALDLDMDLSL